MTKNSSITLNKYIAHAGYCSRRAATEYIKKGKVCINGTVVLTPFSIVQTTDTVTVDNTTIIPEKKIYILLNKPKNVICTASDENNRRTVTDLFLGVFKERLYPIGRLDRSTTGLIIMTNDGDLTQRLSHPKYEVSKTYQVTSLNAITKKTLETLLAGVPLEDGFMKVDEAFYPTSSKKIANVSIHSGKNHIVRRLFEELGHPDIKLDRFSYAGLTKNKLRSGEWRHLTPKEVEELYQSSKHEEIETEKKQTIKKQNIKNKAKKYFARL